MDMQISEQKCSQIEIPSISAPTAHKDSGFIFKSRFIFWGKIAVTVLTLALLISVVKIEAFIGVLKTAKLSYIGVAFFIIVANNNSQIDRIVPRKILTPTTSEKIYTTAIITATLTML